MSTIRDSVFLLLGATGGIGSELARQLAATGARLVLAGRKRDRLDALAGETGGEAFPMEAAQLDSVHAAAELALDRLGRLDGIANCVGSVLLKPAHLTSEQEWLDTLQTNLGSAFAAVRAAGKLMRGGGSVVLVSSAAARTGLANHEAIAAAKAGIQGLALSAAATYAGRGLRVNTVAPGLVETPLTARITGSERAREASRAMHALGRLGRPADVAALIAWLLGPESSWITGQVIGVDGGLASLRARGS